MVPASRSGAGQRVAMTLRAPAASHARVMPISPAPGRTRPRPELQPFSTTNPTLAGRPAVSMSLNKSTRLPDCKLRASIPPLSSSAGTVYAPPRGAPQAAPGAIPHACLVARNSFQERGRQAVSAPHGGTCLDFPGASRQTRQFHRRRYCSPRERTENGSFGLPPLARQPRVGAVINRVSHPDESLLRAARSTTRQGRDPGGHAQRMPLDQVLRAAGSARVLFYES